MMYAERRKIKMNLAGLKLPSIGKLVTLTITLLVLFFVIRQFAPESVKAFFRV